MVIKITRFPGDMIMFVPSQEQHGAFTAGKNKKPQHCNKLEIHMDKIRLRLRHTLLMGAVSILLFHDVCSWKKNINN